jgi:hypothetical protein
MASDLTPVDVTGPDDEALERTWLTLDEALTAVADGTINDGKSLVGIFWLARRIGRE